MKKKFLSIFIALVLVLSFSLVTAVPVAAASIIHVPGNYATIQEAINAAGSDDIIIVAAGTYAQDLVIPVGKENLELVGATGAIIKGVATELDSAFPYTVPNINILADGVTIHGFTIESPDAVVGQYASGMLIGAANVEIYDNAFLTHTPDTGQYPVVIQTWRKVVVGFETVNISGLNIHDNTFTGDGLVGYDGIFVNLDTGSGLVTIAANTFGGSLLRAISVERSNVVIGGNTITSTLVGAYQGIFIGCFELNEGQADGPEQTNVSIIGNTVENFVQGIRVGHSTEQLGFSGIVVSQNTVEANTDGIVVKAKTGATPVDVVINYNNILTNTNFGVNNATTDNVLIDVTLNWWGTTDGAAIVLMVSGNVDYSLWLGGEYNPSTVTMTATYIYTPPVIGISVLPLSVTFGEVEPGVASPLTPDVTVTNTGNVAVNLDATIINESVADVYTTGLTIDSLAVGVWGATPVVTVGVGADTGLLPLVLTVPSGTAPGTYTATLVFWAEATP